MVKNLSVFLVYFFLLGIVIFISSCKSNSESLSDYDSDNGNGLYVYATDISSHQEFQYQEIDVTKVEITGEPIISYSDILYYDTSSHILTLNIPNDSLHFEKNVQGTPFLVTLDGEKIYGGWFWTSASSAICNWVIIELDCPFEKLSENQIRIKLGYPSEDYFKGKDPRNNPSIIINLAANNIA